MGEAHYNPNSLQFRGALPDNILDAKIVPKVTPSEAWMEAHPEYQEGGPGPQPPLKDMEIAFMLVGLWVFPSELLRKEPQKWPGAEAPVACIFRIPLLEFRRRVDEILASRGIPPQAPLEEEPGAEVAS